MTSLLTPSGGLIYHLRALRYRAGLWAPFRSAVAVWLEATLPPEPRGELILVGPSAGHCLPLEQLRRFERLLVLEPDAWARRWLLRRLSHPHVEVETRDRLVAPLLRGEAGLAALLAERPHASVLFCNLLGQLQFGLSDREHEQLVAGFREQIVPALAGRRWASFHDRWSLDRAAVAGAAPFNALSFDVRPSDQALGRACFGVEGESITALDHGTAELFPALWPHHYFAWQLTPKALHVVEAVSGVG